LAESVVAAPVILAIAATVMTMFLALATIARGTRRSTGR
jgi:hypothetical protein